MRLFFVVGLVLIVCAWSIAAERTSAPPPAKQVSRTATAAKVTKMRAPGTILEITDTTLVIERKDKDNVETMTFVLDKPVKFKAGDKVRVSYIEDKGKRIVTRIIKVSDLKDRKQIKPGQEMKPAGAVTKGSLPAAK